ncbi:MAG: hypothetical protein RLY71_1272 [Pseudomonadota bacterium]
MNDTNVKHDTHSLDAAILEARFGLRLAAKLDEGASELPHDIQERLRVARSAAVARARHQRQLVSASASISSGSGTITLGGPDEPWWVRLGSILAPVLVLLAGLLFIQEWQHIEQVDAAAQIDAEILADNLPPQAYADPGFSEFLQSPPMTIMPAGQE